MNTEIFIIRLLHYFERDIYLCQVTDDKGSQRDEAPVANKSVGVYGADNEIDGHGNDKDCCPRGDVHAVRIYAERVDDLQATMAASLKILWQFVLKTH